MALKIVPEGQKIIAQRFIAGDAVATKSGEKSHRDG
jgi:hypothetical protein